MKNTKEIRNRQKIIIYPETNAKVSSNTRILIRTNRKITKKKSIIRKDAEKYKWKEEEEEWDDGLWNI